MKNRPESCSVVVSAAGAARLSPNIPAVSAAPVRKCLRFDKKLGFMLVLLIRQILVQGNTWLRTGRFDEGSITRRPITEAIAALGSLQGGIPQPSPARISTMRSVDGAVQVRVPEPIF